MVTIDARRWMKALVPLRLIIVATLMASVFAGASWSFRSVRAQIVPAMADAPTNVNDVMRGLLFPNANLIFDVQVRDPGSAVPEANRGDPSQDTPPSVRFGSIYTGWQQVEYAAVALSESALLMEVPGRLCSSGKPAPLDQELWKASLRDLVTTATTVRRAAQARNRDAIIEATDALSEACLACHQSYRDRRGVERCTP